MRQGFVIYCVACGGGALFSLQILHFSLPLLNCDCDWFFVR